MTGPRVAAAMVLAAGRGERMRPLSDTLPKPALPLPDGPVVRSALQLAAATETGRVVVNVWHLAERMEGCLSAIDLPGVTLSVSHERLLMGTAGGLALARDRGLLGDSGPVLVVNGDISLDLSLDPLLSRFESSRDLVTLALLPHPDPSRWSRVRLDDVGLVTALLPPASSPPDEQLLLYPGVMVVSREALRALPAEPRDTPGALWEPARAAGRLGGAEVAGTWREIGTPIDYLNAVRAQLGGLTAVHPTATVASGAETVASYIGEDSHVGNGSKVADSVTACGVRVGRHARVVRSVLLGPLEIADGETVVDEVRAAPLGE